MKKITSIVTLALCLLLFLPAYGCGETLKVEEAVDFVLDVEEGREVRILQLTDIQIIDSSQQRYEGRLPSWSITNWAPDRMEALAFKYMRQTVARVQPDLIVLTGDNMYGEFDDNGTVLQALIAEMESYGIPWTATFGNHDNESKKGVAWQCEQYMAAEHCLFTRGSQEAEGNGNFTVGIRQGGKLTEVLYLMDSHGCVAADSEEQVYSTPGFKEGQLAWFEATAQNVRKCNGGKNVPSLAFFHHPLRGYGAALQQYGYTSTRHSFYTPEGDWKSFSKVVIPENDRGDSGVMNEDAGQYIDPDFVFVELLKTYGGEGVFFGHDHVNNCSVAMDGIRYTYGLKASEYDSFTKGEIGGTQILVGQGLKVQHVYYDEAWQA